MPSRSSTAPRIRIEVLLDEADRRSALYDATFWSLRERPKELPAVWLYDERGSLLFEQITRLPEYYLTGCEREILVAHAAEIAARTEARTLVELGSGTSEKTRLLLDALHGAGTLERFVPLDVSGSSSGGAVDALRTGAVGASSLTACQAHSQARGQALRVDRPFVAAATRKSKPPIWRTNADGERSSRGSPTAPPRHPSPKGTLQ